MFRNNDLRHLHQKKLSHGKGLVNHPQCDRRDFLCGEMNADEIVNHPIHIQQSLQARRRFGIGIGLASIGGTFPSQRTEKSFGMVGVNLFLFYGLLRGVPPKGLDIWAVWGLSGGLAIPCS